MTECLLWFVCSKLGLEGLVRSHHRHWKWHITFCCREYSTLDKAVGWNTQYRQIASLMGIIPCAHATVWPKGQWSGDWHCPTQQENEGRIIFELIHFSRARMIHVRVEKASGLNCISKLRPPLIHIYPNLYSVHIGTVCILSIFDILLPKKHTCWCHQMLLPLLSFHCLCWDHAARELTVKTDPNKWFDHNIMLWIDMKSTQLWVCEWWCGVIAQVWQFIMQTCSVRTYQFEFQNVHQSICHTCKSQFTTLKISRYN